jgi:soluble lytic murein transglycosylase-like protein
MMTVVGIVAGQDRHDDRALRERAIRLEPFIVAAAKRYGIDARILRAICFIESRYRINAVSRKGARGPMQFMPETAARYGLRNPHNPEQAIDAAARYFRDLLRKFDGRVDLALAAYNAGEGTISSFMTGKPLVLRDGRIVNARGAVTGGIPPYAETQRYVRSVLMLLSNSMTARVERSNVRLPRITRRDFTLDAFDLSERAQEFSHRRGSTFIEVQ